MKLNAISYEENTIANEKNPWALHSLSFGLHNLIVGRNATGKTRIINVIHNLAKLIQPSPLIIDGEWSVEFTDDAGQNLVYCIKCRGGKVDLEKISINNVLKLERTTSQARIFSEVTSKWQEISPPNDRLVLHVRRDKNEFPYLESLANWSIGVRGFAFANTSPFIIEIPGNPSQLTSLNAVPFMLEKLTEAQMGRVLKQLEGMGYQIESASTAPSGWMPPNVKIINLKELGIKLPLKQFEISQGLFRAFSLLVIIEFLKSSDAISTILLDDFGEGLDFERSKKLAEIIFQNKSTPQIQFIATTNDAFLMNAIPLTDLIICYRQGQNVKCLNYLNSKEKFDEWSQLGLNNFDLFSSNYLSSSTSQDIDDDEFFFVQSNLEI